MEQVRVHRCDKAIWLFTCLSFLTIASVLVIVILYMPDLPRWIAYGLPGAFAALACFSAFIAFSRYEVRGGRLFLVSLAGAREVELRWEQAPLVVSFDTGGRKAVQIRTRSKRKRLFATRTAGAFDTDVRKLFDHLGPRRIPDFQTYGSKRFVDYLTITHAALMTGLSSYALIIALSSKHFLILPSLSLLLVALGYFIVTALRIRHPSVIRNGTKLTTYSLLGRKTAEISLGEGLHVSMRASSVMYLGRGGQSIKLNVSAAADNALVYDAFAIAEGSYEFVGPRTSGRS